MPAFFNPIFDIVSLNDYCSVILVIFFVLGNIFFLPHIMRDPHAFRIVAGRLSVGAVVSFCIGRAWLSVLSA